jgi:uncharacterized membrane protein (Fun14 family)
MAREIWALPGQTIISSVSALSLGPDAAHGVVLGFITGASSATVIAVIILIVFVIMIMIILPLLSG